MEAYDKELVDSRISDFNVEKPVLTTLVTQYSEEEEEDKQMPEQRQGQ